MIFVFWILAYLEAYSLNDLNNNEYTYEISGLLIGLIYIH